MYKDAVTVGLGYLVYKQIMAELAQEPVNGAKTTKAGELLGWDTPAEFEQGLKLWAGVPEGCTVSSGFQVNCPPPSTGIADPYKGQRYCRTDWTGARKCTTTPPTITMPLDMTGVTEQEVVSGIDWEGYENVGRFFK
tara:strand:- start:2 stop:412 length:411 start_codon:yes stop_codon:yes gene_type:complete